MSDISRRIKKIAPKMRAVIEEVDPVTVNGRIKRVIGTLIYATLPSARIGDICLLVTRGEDFELEAEVVGLDNESVILTPLGDMYGISTNTEVIATGRRHEVPVGEALLGRVLDGLGRPVDVEACGPLEVEETRPIYANPPDPLTRKPITEPFMSGIRVMDGLLTAGYGQRLGIFAAAGGGKSTLLSMLVNGADADVVVLALIGERGREVREFIEHHLGEEGLKRTVLVVSTSDRPPVERAKSAYVATTIAEYFRDQNKRVLLLMDSVTRFARALREIGLAAGEPATRRGFPPSVFAELPRLMERAGQSSQGSITAFYTVLVEGDDMNEPISDESRSILDGHIILSKKLGSKGHYPAIDVMSSASRIMDQIISEQHRYSARYLRELMAKYNDVELLVKIGEYKEGSDPIADEAIAKNDEINDYLKQDERDRAHYSETISELQRLSE